MKIDANSEIHGVPALALRAALQKNRSGCYSAGGFAALLDADPKKALSILQRLESDGLIRKDLTKDVWVNSINGNALASASAAPRITRATAIRVLADLVVRASAINADPKYAYAVARMAVFGSYLSDAPRLSDVDVWVQLRRRDSDPAKQAIVEEEALRRNPPPRCSSIIDWIGQTEREVWKLLKARSRSLQLGSTIPDGARHQVIFQEEG